MRRRDVKIIVVPILIFFVFLFGIIGYHQVAGPDFSLAGAIYSTLFFFILNNISLADATNNVYLLIARYLAALMLGFGIYSLLYRYLRRWFQLLKVKYGYRDYVIVFSMKAVGEQFISDLRKNGYQVVIVEERGENEDLDKMEANGVVVFRENEHTAWLFDALQLWRAKACVIASDDDGRNIDLSLKLIQYLRAGRVKQPVKVLMHIEKRSNLEAIRDHLDISNAGAFDLEIFNVPQTAARKIYDDYPPHNYLDIGGKENTIAVIGYNAVAEDFLLENIILSHYNESNLRIYFVEKDSEARLQEFTYQYPFFHEFVEIVPVKTLNNKFFADFAQSELMEQLSKVKIAYLFGDDGSELMNTAVRFRQFLAGHSPDYLSAPVVACFPEDTEVMSLLDAERQTREKLSGIFQELHISFVNMRSDTCTSGRLLEESEYIDMLSRVINYYYSIKYEFAVLLQSKYSISNTDELILSIERKLQQLPDTNKEITERDVENAVLAAVGDVTRQEQSGKADFGIAKWWNQLSYHKKSANRYAARHLAVKINIMKNIGCMPITHQNILNSFPVTAPIEHKRWSAEKMVLNYRYGVLPKERDEKERLKERLKIHDQLVPYEKLSDLEKERDLNIFLLIPLLNSLKLEKKN